MRLGRILGWTLFLVLLPLAAFAEDGSGQWQSSAGLGLAVGAGLAIGLAGLGCGSNTTAGIARNPGAAGSMFVNFILAMVLIESIAIYSFVIALLMVFKIPDL
jgi:F-type H+-transporting ATPase subunit c